ncbi:type II toxin-antitoxin system death-on-curing family toxin [bacterium]|nr:type II toxin-antitoxin system death-on-curing family toxin [bacterium]
MRYLSTREALYLHHRIIEETGGSHGVRDLALLESALSRPQATFGGDDLYPTSFLKAGALLHSLANNHPFVDGNKRTAIACANFFLEDNLRAGIECAQEEIVDLGLKVARGLLKVEEIAHWLKENTRPIEP